MLCLAAVERRIDVEPFKELAKSAYAFWTGSLPAPETRDALKRLYHPGISALFNLKRALMIESSRATDSGTPPSGPVGQEAAPPGGVRLPWPTDVGWRVDGLVRSPLWSRLSSLRMWGEVGRVLPGPLPRPANELADFFAA
jgi:hypothetical protein